MQKTRDRKENVFVKYTLCFSLISLFIILIFIRFRKGFMWFHQHMISLSYWRFVLLKFFSTGKFLTFTWSVGCGIDTFANLAYYVMGDFLSILSVFFTEDKLYLLYYMLCFVRTADSRSTTKLRCAFIAELRSIEAKTVRKATTP